MMKLIRDKIPEIMEKSGVVCNYAAIQNDELYQTLLRQKFVEEVNEFLASGTLEELADVQTVLNALVAAKKDEFERIYADKLVERGGFDKKYIGFFNDESK